MITFASLQEVCQVLRAIDLGACECTLGGGALTVSEECVTTYLCHKL